MVSGSFVTPDDRITKIEMVELNLPWSLSPRVKITFISQS
jgi:hypothetical protein